MVFRLDFPSRELKRSLPVMPNLHRKQGKKNRKGEVMLPVRVSSNGKTAASKPVDRGSIPLTRANSRTCGNCRFFDPEKLRAHIEGWCLNGEATLGAVLQTSRQSTCKYHKFVPEAQPDEQLISTQHVAGSNPVGHATRRKPPKCLGCDDLSDPPSKYCPGCQAYREHQQ